jgi:hypothetical protein
MAALSQQEIGQFMLLFNRGGYVLNFSTSEFDVFTMRSVGVALCAKYKASKGKSLIAFLDDANDADKFRIISDLFAYYEEEFKSEYSEGEGDGWFTAPQFDEKYKRQYLKCREIMNRFSPIVTPLAPVAEALKEKFSSEYLSKQITLMIAMQEENPTEAIGKAKELIESCCKTILDVLGIAWDKDWTVANLAGETMEQLKLMPADIPETAVEAKNMKALLGNLLQVASRMAELRNPYGSGHGKSASFKGLEPRHAKLAVGASITLVTFFWETYEKRSKP